MLFWCLMVTRLCVVIMIEFCEFGSFVNTLGFWMFDLESVVCVVL